MAKTAVDQWDETAALNTDINSINIDEGMSPSDVNDAIREIMAQIKTYTLAVIPAGVVKAYLGSTAPAGWLLLNGDTLGSTASSADQNLDDYETLFTLIWNQFTDTEAPVISGRGVSAAADWAANKAITMPDATGRVIAGEESTATRLTTAISGIDGGILGTSGGDESAQDHEHPQTGSGNTTITTGGPTQSPIFGTADTGLASAGGTNGAKMGGDSANVQPTLVLAWVVKF